MPHRAYLYPLGFPKNSVDVVGDDGLFHHGIAVRCTKEGVVVNFCFTGGQSQLIPYGKVYRSEEPTLIRHMGWMMEQGLEERRYTERSVEVLMRADPKQPWKWFPATLLAADFEFLGSSGIVRATVADRTLEGILPAVRIRAPPSSDVLPGLLVDEGFSECKKASGKWKKASRKEKKNGKKVILSDGLQFLPRNILMEIFKCVDTIQQANLRRVCSMWNSVLTLSTIAKDLWLDYHVECSDPLGFYIPFAFLYKCCDNRTRTIIFTEDCLFIEQFYLDRLGLVNYLARVLELRGSLCKTLVLANMRLDCFDPDDGEEGLDPNVRDWLAPLHGYFERMMLHMPAALGCQTLLMKSVDISVQHYWSTDTFMRLSLDFVLHITETRIDVAQCKSLGNIWGKLNSSVPAVDAGDMVHLAEWVHEVGTTDNTDLWAIAQILQVLQSSDSRKAVQYQQVRWFPIGPDRHITDLDVTHLTRLTQYGLWMRYNDRSNRRLRIDLRW